MANDFADRPFKSYVDSKPKDAAAVILLRSTGNSTNPEVFWVKRSEKLAFLGGYHAFPGGQLDQEDLEQPVVGCSDPQTAAMIHCAARELFEEVGVLLARGGELLTKGQRSSVLDDLKSGRMTWPALMRHYDLHLDAADYMFVGRWLTPPFSPRRFNTCFFLVTCPPKQQPEPVDDAELASGEWIPALEAYARWERAEVLAVPPILHALRTLGEGVTEDLVDRFLFSPHAHGEPVRRIEFRPGFMCFPVRTPTRPPATHTNCYLIHSNSELLVIDPGSPYEDEQRALSDCVTELLEEGRTLRGIVLTHLHPDHVGGVEALRHAVGGSATVLAHPITAEALKGSVSVNKVINDGDVIELKGEPTIKLRAVHTPGHARGHLCFHEARTGALITGDNIVGLGSVLIDPPEGNMSDYIASLRRLRSIEGLSVLFGGHGPAMANPYTKIDEYINHRLDRERKILDAVHSGATEPPAIVARVYTDVPPKLHNLAERAVLAHLEKLQQDGLVSEKNGHWQ